MKYELFNLNVGTHPGSRAVLVVEMNMGQMADTLTAFAPVFGEMDGDLAEDLYKKAKSLHINLYSIDALQIINKY
ncbi:MAG: hypothetical protein ABR512_12565 [Desulfopila sp.]